ncbi:hypothetical protein ACT2CI_00655 [Candidatus Vidania fulgoroideorum]
MIKGIVFEFCNKQYYTNFNKIIKTNNVNNFSAKVLMLQNDREIFLGKPYLNIKIKFRKYIIKKEKKKIIKFKRRKRYKIKKGFTKKTFLIKIIKIWQKKKQ